MKFKRIKISPHKKKIYTFKIIEGGSLCLACVSIVILCVLLKELI